MTWKARLKISCLGLALAGLLGLGLWYHARVTAYDKLLRYQPAQDYLHDLDHTESKQFKVDLNHGGFTWPKGAGHGDTVLLRLRVDTGLVGALRDPLINVEAGDERFRQFFERGAKGVRFLNLSPLSHHRVKSGQRVSLKGANLTWPRQQADLFVYRNAMPPMARILVVAPHPDDAEIAAFGFYSHRDAYIITLTAGEAGNAFVEPFQESKRQGQITKGKLRVWDSIAAPFWGGLGLGRGCNLGYFDASLSWMYHHPDEEVRSAYLQPQDIKMFRRCQWAGQLNDKKPKATWKNLVADLVHVLKSLKPQLIVMPHPLLDAHPDHRYGALAVFQALAEAGLSQGELLLYTNHHILTEIYPFGEDDGLVSLPPWFQGDWLFSRVYSYQLRPGQQRDKYFALEAMHDLRESLTGQNASSNPLVAGWDKAVGEMLATDDARSYFRRAVRPNELFFVVPLTQMPRLRAEAEKALR